METLNFPYKNTESKAAENILRAAHICIFTDKNILSVNFIFIVKESVSQSAVCLYEAQATF